MTQGDTIGSKLRYYVETQPSRPAIVTSDFAPISYRQLGNQIREVQVELRRSGLNQDARVAVAVQTGPLAALAIVAVSCCATSMPLDPRLTYAEVEKRMAMLRPNAVLLLKGVDSPARRVAESLKIAILEVIPTKDGLLGFNLDRPETGDLQPPAADKEDPDSIAFILGTSGTTSASKLVPTSHRNMIAAAARVKMWFGLTPHDRCLSASPVFYAHGLHVTVFSALLSGGSVAFPSDASKFNDAEWFENLKPTWYSAGPTLHRLIVDQMNQGMRQGHSLRFIVSGGAPLPLKVQEGLRRIFEVPVLEHYGSTECMQICSNQLAPGRSKLGTCGIPSLDTIKIVDEEGQQLPAGSRGEIIIGGPTVTSGYLNVPKLNHTYFIDGWFRSGDIGSIDEEGFLILHGRKDDLINRGGEKIAPAEVEFELLQHPGVAEAAVFSVPHPRLGQDVAAAVVVKIGTSVNSLELRAFLRDRLVSFKVPKHIYIVDALPKGSTGKVLRSSLRELDFQQRGRRVLSQDATEILIAEIWQKLLQTDEIGIDEEFFEAGGDSLLAEQMFLEVESLINRPIPPSALSEGLTIRRLAAITKAGLDTDRENELVTKAREAAGTPFFYCHGDFTGRGLYALKLAELIDPPQPVFLVHALQQIPDTDMGPTIEGMARLYVPHLLAAQPEGPFRLGGHCNGGLLAFEIARQLRGLGREVELVLMIDGFSINCLWPLRLARSMIGAFASVTPASQFREKLVQRGMIFLWNRFGHVFVALAGLRPIWPPRVIFNRVPRKPADAPIINRSDLSDAYLSAMANYIPSKLDCTVVAIVSREEADNPLILPLAWKSRAPIIRQQMVPGTHLGCITVEVKALANCIGSTLEDCN